MSSTWVLGCVLIQGLLVSSPFFLLMAHPARGSTQREHPPAQPQHPCGDTQPLECPFYIETLMSTPSWDSQVCLVISPLQSISGVGAQPRQREALLSRWAVRSHGPLGFSVWPGQPGSTVIECPGAGAHHRPGSAWDHRACGRDPVGSHSWHPDVCSPEGGPEEIWWTR